jgi:RNA polymerase sigma-70 factor (ECF subfamily)
MNFNTKDTLKLIKDCIKHDRKAQKALYQLYYSYCMSICMRYASTRDDAVEMMNDGFMNVFTYLHKFDLKRPFTPWLRRVMINSSIDHLKKHSKIETPTGLENTLPYTETEAQPDSVSYEDLLLIIRKLPPAYAAVFNLRAIEGYKHEEVAGILGISVGASKSNYAKAKRKLQEYLAIYFEVNR